MSGLDALMNCLMSETVCVRLNLATIREPSAKRNWMDVAACDSLTPAQGVDTVVDAGGCDVLAVAVLEGPAISQCCLRIVVEHRLVKQDCGDSEVLARCWCTISHTGTPAG